MHFYLYKVSLNSYIHPYTTPLHPCIALRFHNDQANYTYIGPICPHSRVNYTYMCHFVPHLSYFGVLFVIFILILRISF